LPPRRRRTNDLVGLPRGPDGKSGKFSRNCAYRRFSCTDRPAFRHY
jgi:hypothetical protein